jgi:hypothetical protein
MMGLAYSNLAILGEKASEVSPVDQGAGADATEILQRVGP